MQETTRQRQVASLIQEQMSALFIENRLHLFNNNMATIIRTYVTPDLLVARTYLSIYTQENKQSYIDMLNENNKAIRTAIAPRIRNKVRRIPQFEFFLDDSLDTVFRLEEIFKEINKTNKPSS